MSQAFANMRGFRTDNVVPLKSLLAASESKPMAKLHPPPQECQVIGLEHPTQSLRHLPQLSLCLMPISAAQPFQA